MSWTKSARRLDDLGLAARLIDDALSESGFGTRGMYTVSAEFQLALEQASSGVLVPGLLPKLSVQK